MLMGWPKKNKWFIITHHFAPHTPCPHNPYWQKPHNTRNIRQRIVTRQHQNIGDFTILLATPTRWEKNLYQGGRPWKSFLSRCQTFGWASPLWQDSVQRQASLPCLSRATSSPSSLAQVQAQALPRAFRLVTAPRTPARTLAQALLIVCVCYEPLPLPQVQKEMKARSKLNHYTHVRKWGQGSWSLTFLWTQERGRLLWLWLPLQISKFVGRRHSWP